MLAWVRASMSGLTRSATRATRPMPRASSAMRSSSPADSALIVPTPLAIASSSSSRVLPTPVNTMSFGSNPARSATCTLSAGVGVDAAAERAQQPHQRERRVRLQRVVDGVRIVGERGVDRPIGVPDGLRAVDVDGRAHAFDDGLHADAVAEETLRGGLER